MEFVECEGMGGGGSVLSNEAKVRARDTYMIGGI